MQPVVRNNPWKQSVLLILIALVSLSLVAISAIGVFDFEPDDRFANVVLDNPEGEPDDDDWVDEWDDEWVDEPAPTPEPELDSFNPLTGLPLDEARTRDRPLAVSLSNVPEALPMNGVSEADIIYEVLVEGGLTRMLALFQDTMYVPKIGSIRSARHYTADIAHSYNAIFVTAGGSPQAYREVRAEGVTHLDEVGGTRREIFQRDRNRVPGRRFESLHSVVITGDRVRRWFPQYDFELQHDRNYELGLVFVEDGTPERGSIANDVVVNFSSGKSTTFKYSSSENAYHMRQFNNTEFVDANNNKKPAFTNILILHTRVTGIANDGSGRRNVETVGEGEGYFVNGGRYIEIDWFREDKEAPFVYTLKNGSILELGAGKTYICIIPTNMTATFS